MDSRTTPANRDIPAAEPSRAVKFFASAAFTGYFPVASGTAGSALALALYCIPGFESPLFLGGISAAVFVFGVKAASLMEIRYGHDPGEVTIDEVTGMWISLLFLPKTLPVGLCAFVLFRLFDIVKPVPASTFDRMNGGFGIMMDDVTAGVYANITVQALLLIPAVHSLLLR